MTFCASPREEDLFCKTATFRREYGANAAQAEYSDRLQA